MTWLCIPKSVDCHRFFVSIKPQIRTLARQQAVPWAPCCWVFPVVEWLVLGFDVREEVQIQSSCFSGYRSNHIIFPYCWVARKPLSVLCSNQILGKNGVPISQCMSAVFPVLHIVILRKENGGGRREAGGRRRGAEVEAGGGGTEGGRRRGGGKYKRERRGISCPHHIGQASGSSGSRFSSVTPTYSNERPTKWHHLL